VASTFTKLGVTLQPLGEEDEQFFTAHRLMPSVQ
jgi:hypothetical protein